MSDINFNDPDAAPRPTDLSCYYWLRHFRWYCIHYHGNIVGAEEDSRRHWLIFQNEIPNIMQRYAYTEPKDMGQMPPVPPPFLEVANWQEVFKFRPCWHECCVEILHIHAPSIVGPDDGRYWKLGIGREIGQGTMILCTFEHCLDALKTHWDRAHRIFGFPRFTDLYDLVQHVERVHPKLYDRFITSRHFKDAVERDELITFLKPFYEAIDSVAGPLTFICVAGRCKKRYEQQLCRADFKISKRWEDHLRYGHGLLVDVEQWVEDNARGKGHIQFNDLWNPSYGAESESSYDSLPVARQDSPEQIEDARNDLSPAYSSSSDSSTIVSWKERPPKYTGPLARLYFPAPDVQEELRNPTRDRAFLEQLDRDFAADDGGERRPLTLKDSVPKGNPTERPDDPNFDDGQTHIEPGESVSDETWRLHRDLGEGGQGVARLWILYNKDGEAIDTVVLKDTYNPRSYSHARLFHHHRINTQTQQLERVPLEGILHRRISEAGEKYVAECYYASTICDGRVSRLYLEYAPFGDFWSLSGKEAGWHFSGWPPEPLAWQVLYALAKAMWHMKYGKRLTERQMWAPIIHRDVKPQNVLLVESRSKHARASGYPTAVLTDFGLSFDSTKANRQKLEHVGWHAGTSNYMAPEIAGDGYIRLDGSLAAQKVVRLSSKIDVFSTGVTMMLLIAGKTIPDEFYNCFAQRQAIAEDVYDEFLQDRTSGPYSKDLKHLIKSCLSINPSKRPTVSALLRSARKGRRKYGAIPYEPGSITHTNLNDYGKQANAIIRPVDRNEINSKGNRVPRPEAVERQQQTSGANTSLPGSHTAARPGDRRSKRKSDEIADQHHSSKRAKSSSRNGKDVEKRPQPRPGSGPRYE